MLSKCLEKKVQLLQEEYCDDGGNNIELEYYLLESDFPGDEEIAGEKTYGIEIVKTETNIKIETEYIRNISCCRENVATLLEKLATNSVTPVGLPFVIDDLIGV